MLRSKEYIIKKFKLSDKFTELLRINKINANNITLTSNPMNHTKSADN